MKNLIFTTLIFFAATVKVSAQNYAQADRLFEQAEKEYDKKEYSSAYTFAVKFIREETRQNQPRILKLDDAHRIIFFVNHNIKNLKYNEFIRLSNSHLTLSESKKYLKLPVIDVVNIVLGLKNFEQRKNHISLLDRMIMLMKKHNPDDKRTLKLLECEKENYLKKRTNAEKNKTDIDSNLQ
jgi:hypothetical protein